MAAELELPEHVFVHGYLLMDGEKMSKSLGNVLDPFAVIERFGADALRFYLLRDVPFGQDGSVSTASFEQRYETELANELGNLASRTIAMVPRYRDGRRPPPGRRRSWRARLRRACPSGSAELIDRAELTLALDEIWQRVRRLNRYVEEQAPWQLAKDEARADELDRVLGTLVEGLRMRRGAAAALPAGAAPRRCSARSARRSCRSPARALGRRARRRSSRSSRCSRRTACLAGARAHGEARRR